MSRVNTILGQLQDRLTMHFDRPKTVDTEGVAGGGPEFINQYPPKDDDVVDEPEAFDTPYVTNRPFILPTGGKRSNKLPESKGLKEQEDDPEEEAADAADTGEDIAADVGGGETPNIGGEETAGDMNAGMGDMGAGMGIPGLEQEEPKTASQLGRIYELKKIYSRLTSIESYLGNESSTELLEIRNLVSKSIELFEIVSSNFDSYKEKLDEIIIMYYKFILEVYKEVEGFFKKESKSSGD